MGRTSQWLAFGVILLSVVQIVAALRLMTWRPRWAEPPSQRAARRRGALGLVFIAGATALAGLIGLMRPSTALAAVILASITLMFALGVILIVKTLRRGRPR